MLDLYDLFDRISIYVIKSNFELGLVETQGRYVPNLNETYTSRSGEDMDLRLSDDASDVRDDMDIHLNSPPVVNFSEWRLEAPKSLPETTESPFKPLHNHNSPTTHDLVIDDSED